MSTFAGVANDLDEAVAYELQALEYLRACLFSQTETPDGGMMVTLGDMTDEGRLRKHLSLHLEVSISEEAVRSALGRLRPLAFSAGFKMHDMIVEWILRANGVNDWPFSKKLRAYDQLLANGTLVEPIFLAQRSTMSKAFWELYRHFVPYRGTVIHSGGVVLKGDGTVEITKSSNTLRLTDEEQGFYIRAMCMIANHHVGRAPINPHLEGLLEADMSRLVAYHSVQGLRMRQVRLEQLVVNVPTDHIQNMSPLSVGIDFDLLRDTMARAYPVGSSGELFFSVSVVVDRGATKSRWQLPIEAVPTGVVALTEGDAAFDQFLSHETAA